MSDLPHYRTIADHYRAGRGEPVLLIHGFTATWRAWGEVPARLAQEYDVLAVTLPGHTDGPELPEGDSIPRLVDALEAMLDEVGWTDAHLVGFSLGGWLSLELAKRGRARTVTAVAPGGAETEHHDRESRRIRWLFARLHLGARMMLPLADDLCRRPRFRKLAMQDQMVDGSKLKPRESAAMIRAFATTPVFKRFLAEIGSSGAGLTELDQVKVPVTVLWGEKDRVLPERLHGSFFRRELPHATYRTMANAGHVPFWEATEAVVDGVRDTVSMAGAGFEPA